MNCLVFGATGATGFEFVKKITTNPNWNVVYIVCRKMLPEWTPLKTNPKFKFLETENIVDKNIIKNELLKNSPIETVFNFLGSRVGMGEEIFRRIDHDYIIESAKIAEEIGAQQFHHVLPEGAKKDSWFLFLRVKGETFEDLQKIKLNTVAIYMAGLITDRKDQRFGEKMGSWVPCIAKIKCSMLAENVIKYAEMNRNKINPEALILQNKDILKL